MQLLEQAKANGFHRRKSTKNGYLQEEEEKSPSHPIDHHLTNFQEEYKMRTISHNSVLIWNSKEESDDRARHFHVFCGEIEVCIYEKMKKVFSWVNFLVRLSSTTKSKSQMNNQLEIGCLSNDHAVRGMV